MAHEVASTFGFPCIGEVATTHPKLLFFYFQQIPSFPLFELLAKTIGGLVSSIKFGVVFKLGFL
jgi:hypothetical protein